MSVVLLGSFWDFLVLLFLKGFESVVSLPSEGQVSKIAWLLSSCGTSFTADGLFEATEHALHRAPFTKSCSTRPCSTRPGTGNALHDHTGTHKWWVVFREKGKHNRRRKKLTVSLWAEHAPLCLFIILAVPKLEKRNTKCTVGGQSQISATFKQLILIRINKVWRENMSIFHQDQ